MVVAALIEYSLEAIGLQVRFDGTLREVIVFEIRILQDKL
jgi:hypothetical protein